MEVVRTYIRGVFEMDNLTSWLERYILPLAIKIGSQKHLVALRDAFIGTLPATMAGSVAVMINAILRDLPPQFIDGYDGSTVPVISQIIEINGYVWNGTLAIAGLIFIFSWGYNLARAYKVNDLAGGIVATAAAIAGIRFSFAGTVEGVNLDPGTIDVLNEAGWEATADSITANGWGWLPLSSLDGNFYFTAMIVGFVATMIYIQLMQAEITIKLPETVPPAVSKAFASIIPATVALYITGVFLLALCAFSAGLDVSGMAARNDRITTLRHVPRFWGSGDLRLICTIVLVFWHSQPQCLSPAFRRCFWGSAIDEREFIPRRWLCLSFRGRLYLGAGFF